MSRTPRRTRHLGRHGRPSAPAAGTSSGVGGLRALVEEGIITAAALNARDDLELAAASTHRLGALSSGMWRALSRELATAAERLDRSTMERLEDIQRRSRALEVDADEVVAAGLAALHLAEHRETLETLIPPEADAHRLLATDMLFGFSIDDQVEDEDAPELLTVRVSVQLWPAPLTPASVIIRFSESSDDVAEPESPTSVVEALSSASGLSTERTRQALSSLAMACWTAHHLDERSSDELDEEDSADDVDENGGQDGISAG